MLFNRNNKHELFLLYFLLYFSLSTRHPSPSSPTTTINQARLHHRPPQPPRTTPPITRLGIKKQLETGQPYVVLNIVSYSRNAVINFTFKSECILTLRFLNSLASLSMYNPIRINAMISLHLR